MMNNIKIYYSLINRNGEYVLRENWFDEFYIDKKKYIIDDKSKIHRLVL